MNTNKTLYKENPAIIQTDKNSLKHFALYQGVITYFFLKCFWFNV